MWRSLLCFVLPLAISLNSQTTQIPDSADPTFKAEARLVLVDVAVTDRNGHPVTGLQPDDFEIFESADLTGRGNEQTITSFEEHKGASPRIEPPHPLAPNTYTNAPSVASADSVNVLLLDVLDTLPEDQAAIHRQVTEYLKTAAPGPRLAIFSLDSGLRIVKGFSSDDRELIEALNHKNWGGEPHASDPVRTAAEGDANQKLQQQMVNTQASSGGIQSLQTFVGEQNATEQVSRVSGVLEAIRLLCRYLSGFPGRKNLIWFSGSFPNILVSNLGERVPNLALERELKETLNLLASAQVAVYPVAAHGVETDPLFQADQLAPMLGDGPAAKRVLAGTNQSLDQASTARVANFGAEDEIASNTGGRAFYDNGLKEALSEAVQKGSYYYSVSYSPTDKKTLGRYRRIEVKLRAAHYKLAYRRGYFEEGKGQSPAEQQGTVADPLQPLVRRGLPDATQIIFDLRVLRTAAPVAASPAIAGDNHNLHDSVTRFTADFVVPLDNLAFDITSDGVRHGNVELALVAYDHDGHALNWLFRAITTSLKPEIYPLVLKTGAIFHQEIDIPPGENYLRAGVYDLRSNQAGTLEIPLSKVAAAADTDSTSIQKPLAVAPSLALLTSSTTSQPIIPANSSPTPSPNGTSPISVEAAPESTHPVPQPSFSTMQPVSTQGPKEAEIIDIPVYCAHLSETVQHSSALENVCRFALFTVKRFPDLICDREMERQWIEFRTRTAGDAVPVYSETSNASPYSMISHSDLLTAQVTYRDGQEYYDHLLLNGQPVSSEVSALPPSSLRGPWSMGEFGVILQSIFLPASKAEFEFKKHTHIGPEKALLFTFHVAAPNNRYYFLLAEDKKWFPQYRGELWIAENGFHLLRLERETGRMAEYPIRSAKTTIEYASVSLADGSTLVLPTNSRVNTCTPPGDNCSLSLVKFTGWHKFKAAAKIVANPKN